MSCAHQHIVPGAKPFHACLLDNTDTPVDVMFSRRTSLPLRTLLDVLPDGRCDVAGARSSWRILAIVTQVVDRTRRSLQLYGLCQVQL
jgi:hypothetical protein